MSKDKTEVCELIETLLGVCNMAYADVARRTGISRQNIYSYFKTGGYGMSAERQALILNALGVHTSKLKSDQLHRWYATPDLKNIVEALKLLLTAAELRNVKIVNFAFAAEDSAILVVPNGKRVVFILVHRKLNITETMLPITPANLGFGTALKRLLPMTTDKIQSWIVGDADDQKILHEIREFALSEHAIEEEKLIASMPEFEPEDDDELSEHIKNLLLVAKDRGLSENEILRRIKLALSI